MNRSYSKIRHIQESNEALERRRFSQLLESKLGSVRPILTEAENAQDLAKKAMSGALGKSDKSTMDKIVSCITGNKLTSLDFLTTPTGAAALANIAPLLVPVGSIIGALTTAFSVSALPIFYVLQYMGYPNVVTDDIEKLIDCISQ